jgi:hypothetical protein
MKNVYLLLGGFFGQDGLIPGMNAGMYNLRSQLEKLPDVKVKTFTWDQYQQAADEISGQISRDKTVVIGYSGGGSRATYLANTSQFPIIDLMILYDPSPKWQMEYVGKNVKRAICYQNTMPLFFNLGGGVLKGTNVETHLISEQHIFVQADQKLHEMTIDAVKNL